MLTVSFFEDEKYYFKQQIGIEKHQKSWIYGKFGSELANEKITIDKARLFFSYILELKGKTKRKQRLGADLTFSAPKSVSIVGIVLQDKRVVEAHEDAVKQVLDYVESNYRLIRRQENKRKIKETGKLVVVGMNHVLSRDNDPQLHTHALLLNVAKDSKDKIVSIDYKEILDTQKQLGKIYRQKLAENLKVIGYEVEIIDKDQRSLIETTGLSSHIPKNKRYYLSGKFPSGSNNDLYAYAITIFDNEGHVVDVKIVRTEKTLEKIIKDKQKHNYNILFHPNPILLDKDFYERYRETSSGYERIQLFTEKNILSDENILFIDTITIDIDSPYEQSVVVLEKLVNLLGISRSALNIIKTKSGNLRFAFKVYPINPRKVNKNKKSNLENVKEFVEIINEFFILHNLKADKTFKRINHPIWITGKQEVIQIATSRERFYDIYRKAKQIQRDINKIKQTQERIKKQKNKKLKIKRKKVVLPAFILNKLRAIETDLVLKSAVKTLYENSKGKGTYTYFLQVLAGWCKYLSLSYSEYYDLATEYMPVDRKREKDIKTAWKYARPIEFKCKNVRKEYSVVEYAEKAIKYLENNSTADRQTLLKEVFDNQSWLEQVVMSELEKLGVVEHTFEKQEGKKGGRPKKVYILVSNTEPENACQMEFRQIIDPLDSISSCMVVVGNNIRLPGTETEEKDKEKEKGKPEEKGKKEKGKLEKISDEEFEKEFKNKNKIKNQIEEIKNQEEKEKMEKMVVDLVAYRDRIVGLIERHLNYQGKKISKKQQRHLQEYFFMKFENDMKVIQKGGDGGLLAYFNWLRIFKQIEHDLIEFVERLL